MPELEFILDGVAADGEAYFTTPGGQKYVHRNWSMCLEPIDVFPYLGAAPRRSSTSEYGRRFATAGDAVQYVTAVQQYEHMLKFAADAVHSTGTLIGDRVTREMFRAAFGAFQANLACLPVLRTIPGVVVDYLLMTPEQICERLEQKMLHTA